MKVINDFLCVMLSLGNILTNKHISVIAGQNSQYGYNCRDPIIHFSLFINFAQRVKFTHGSLLRNSS